MEIRKEVRLLIVEDHDHCRQYFQDAVDTWHPQFRIECAFAKNLGEALEYIATWNPSIIMLDAYFGESGCFDALNDWKPQDVPIVITSELPIEGIRESVLQKGALEYFAFSDDPEDIDLVLESVAYLAAEVPMMQQ